MPAPRNYHQFPEPSKATSSTIRQTPSAFNVMHLAKLWRPKGFLMEMVISTLARVALRVVNRETGVAYSADELEAKILDQVGEITLPEDVAVLSGNNTWTSDNTFDSGTLVSFGGYVGFGSGVSFDNGLISFEGGTTFSFHPAAGANLLQSIGANIPGSYANDLGAASAGVPVNGIYHTSGTLKKRLS